MTNTFAVTKHDEGDGVARLAVRGEIDRDVSEAVAAIIVNAARQDGITALVIDVDDVSFLAAAGVQALVDGRAAALRRGLPCQVINAAGVVRDVLLAAGPADLLDVTALPHHPSHRPERLSLF
jgi:anti-anti-sigma factor